MTNLLSFLAEADEAALALERSRRELEAARQNVEASKQAYDAIISRADEMGIPRSKLKRLTEERLTALIDIGLANLPASIVAKATENKPERPKKRQKASAEDAEAIFDQSEGGSEGAFTEVSQ